MDEDELLVDLSAEELDDDILDQAAAEENTEKKDPKKKTATDSGEMDGDIDYPELDLFEEK